MKLYIFFGYLKLQYSRTFYHCFIIKPEKIISKWSTYFRCSLCLRPKIVNWSVRQILQNFWVRPENMSFHKRPHLVENTTRKVGTKITDFDIIQFMDHLLANLESEAIVINLH